MAHSSLKKLFVFLTPSGIPRTFFRMRHVGGLNRHHTALEQTLANMETA